MEKDSREGRREFLFFLKEPFQILHECGSHVYRRKNNFCDFLEIKPKIKQFWAIFKREYTFVAYEMLHTLCLFSITCIIQGV